jgi:hypothetical protein
MIIGQRLSFIDTNHRHSNGSAIRHILKIEVFGAHPVRYIQLLQVKAE